MSEPENLQNPLPKVRIEPAPLKLGTWINYHYLYLHIPPYTSGFQCAPDILAASSKNPPGPSGSAFLHHGDTPPSLSTDGPILSPVTKRLHCNKGSDWLSAYCNLNIIIKLNDEKTKETTCRQLTNDMKKIPHIHRFCIQLTTSDTFNAMFQRTF